MSIYFSSKVQHGSPWPSSELRHITAIWTWTAYQIPWVQSSSWPSSKSTFRVPVISRLPRLLTSSRWPIWTIWNHQRFTELYGRTWCWASSGASVRWRCWQVSGHLGFFLSVCGIKIAFNFRCSAKVHSVCEYLSIYLDHPHLPDFHPRLELWNSLWPGLWHLHGE